MILVRAFIAFLLLVMILALNMEVSKYTGKFSNRILYMLMASHVVCLILGATIAWFGA